MREEDKIWIFGIEDNDDRGLFDRASQLRYGRDEVSVEELRKRIGTFLERTKRIIEELDVRDGFGAFVLNQVTLTVEISASGKVSLMGTGGEVSGKGGMTFTLTRRQPVARPET